MSIPHDGQILKIQSRHFDSICPGAMFEWHMQTQGLYVIRLRAGKALADGLLIAQEVKTPTEAKQAVAAYAQGYTHGKQDAQPSTEDSQ
jgi:hypothetical protein